MTRPALRKIEGGGDIVAYLEELAERARKGDFDAVVVAMVGSDGVMHHGWAYEDDLPFSWAVILAAATDLQSVLLDDGL